MLLDIRKGVCPLCAHNKIVSALPAEFGDADMEKTAAITYEPRWIMGGRNPSHPRGKLRTYVCSHCGYLQQFCEDPENIPLGEKYQTELIVSESGSSHKTHRRRVETNHATLFLSEEALEQNWPSGAIHEILWSKTFSARFHREPPMGYTGPVASVHVRLQQQREDGNHVVAFTLCLEDHPRWQELEPLMSFLPRVEGQEAQHLLQVIQDRAGLHGIRLPF